MDNEERKPPIVFAPTGSTGEMKNAESLYAQNLLLRAMTSGITDPKELQKLAGLKKVTDVYIALDKLSMRKEYHAALERSGMSLDYLIEKLKKVVDSKSEETSLKGVALIIKSLGLDKYESTDEGDSKPWEDIVLDQTAKGETIDTEITEQEDYEVKMPEVPEDIATRRKEIKKEYKELYQD